MINQWLEELERELQDILEEDRLEILSSYKEQVNEMKELDIDEEEILSRLGWPKKVAQEVKQSLDYTESRFPADKDDSKVEKPKSNEKGFKKGISICAIIASLCVSILFFMTSFRFIIGSIFLMSFSIGLAIAVLGVTLILFNIGVASLYTDYLIYKRLN